MPHQGRFFRDCVIAFTSLFLTTWCQAAPRVTYPFVGQVAGDDVYVRSGPSTNHYRTGKLNAGDQVVVYGENTAGWYSIKPPEGSFSWVRSDMVQHAVGKQYLIAKDRVRVRAGMPNSPVMYVVQGLFDQGTPVELISEQKFADGYVWYRIVPPAGVRLYMSKEFVKFVKPYQDGQAVILGKTKSPDSATKPVRPATVGARKTYASTAARAAAAKAQANRSAAAKAYHDAERLYHEIRDRKLAGWNFAGAKKAYQRVITLARSETLKAMATERLRHIQRDESLKQRYDSIDQIGNNKSARVLAAEQNYSELLRKFRQELDTPRIDGSGILQAVEQDLGRSDIKYQLVGPAGDVRALLVSERLQLGERRGRRVGVRGRIEYVPALDARLIHVEQIIEIDRPDHP